jgi:ABC-type Fe3+/spermidine/putrescine transport system ATPase subunit
MVSKRKRQGQSHKVASPEEPLLSPQRAFVLQFYPEADVEHGRFVGRVEHVVSGQTARFDSLDTLVAFLGQVLATVKA